MSELPFVTLDVFTTTPYLGNPLGVVHIPHSQADSITQAQKQQIAKEFNLSETIFIHDSETESTNAESANHKEVRIDIFTTTQELPFAGHPTVGAGFHLSSSLGSAASGTVPPLILVTKAGKIPVTFDASDGGVTHLEVPHAITIHDESLVTLEHAAQVIGLPSTSGIIPNNTNKQGPALISIVKGLSFVLVQVESLEVLGKCKIAGREITCADAGIDDSDGNGFVGVYAYCIRSPQTNGEEELREVRTRLFFEKNFEDPATGSAASALAAYLSIVKTRENQGVDGQMLRYAITSGVEMGRKSDISVS